MALTVPDEPTFNDIDGMRHAVPLPDEPSARFERGALGLSLFIGRSCKIFRKTLWWSPKLSRLDFKAEKPAQKRAAEPLWDRRAKNVRSGGNQGRPVHGVHGFQFCYHWRHRALSGPPVIR